VSTIYDTALRLKAVINYETMKLYTKSNMFQY